MRAHMKLYAIKNPNGKFICHNNPSLIAGSKKTAWIVSTQEDDDLWGIWIVGRGKEAWIKDAEKAGYSCVEVEMVEVKR